MRFLIDGLWPRGVKKSALYISAWIKEVAPSKALRQWFGHDPAKWEEFRRRYFAELNSQATSGQSPAWKPILEAARRQKVTLVYGAHDPEHNNAVALREYLAKKIRKPASKSASKRS